MAIAMLVSRAARVAVESYENRDEQRERTHASQLLTPDEHADLLLEWGGYDTAIGSVRSSFGAALDAARRRSPPRDRPVWDMIVHELDRHSRRMAVDDLVLILSEKENLAMPYEIRRAIRGMIGAGRLTKSIQEMPRTREWIDPDMECRRETYFASTEVVALERRQPWRCPDALPPEERWRRADEDLERYCRGDIPCHETVSRKPSADVDTVSIGSFDVQPKAGPRLSGRPRVILERYYGRSTSAPYRDVLGDMAPLVEYTAAFAKERDRIDKGRKVHSTVHEVLRALLDGAPTELPALVAWRERRKAFVDLVKRQARKELEEACEAYRAARRGA